MDGPSIPGWAGRDCGSWAGFSENLPGRYRQTVVFPGEIGLNIGKGSHNQKKGGGSVLRLYLSRTADGKIDAWALLERALADRGLEQMPAVERAPGGKPYFPDRPELCFSLSHSGPWALCALGDGPVGADVETVRPRRAALLRALSAQELAWFRGRGSRWEDFYTLWTLKEALAKQDGRGLDRRPEHLRVPLLEPGMSAGLDGLGFQSFGGPGWRAAVCGPEPVEGFQRV